MRKQRKWRRESLWVKEKLGSQADPYLRVRDIYARRWTAPNGYILVTTETLARIDYLGDYLTDMVVALDIKQNQTWNSCISEEYDPMRRVDLPCGCIMAELN